MVQYNYHTINKKSDAKRHYDVVQKLSKMFTEISWRIGYMVLSTVGFLHFDVPITFLVKSLRQDIPNSQNSHINIYAVAF